MKKKMIISILCFFILTNIYGCSEKGIGKDKTAQSSTEKYDSKNTSSIVENLNLEDKNRIIEDLYSVKDINEEKKKEIAKDLFDEYINKRKISWEFAKNTNTNPVISFTDYKIGNVRYVSEEGNKFTVEISYDIQYTNESGNMWLAADGDICENNWVRNKSLFVTIEKFEDKYIISNAETDYYENNKKTNTSEVVEGLSKEEKSNLVKHIYSVKDISEDEKKDEARKLFDEYINNNRTDWKMVKNQKLNRNPVVALTDYKIGDIDFVKEEGNKFTVDISYDIKYTKESNMWVAGNGTLCNDSWDRNKCNFVDISRFADTYIITGIYTG